MPISPSNITQDNLNGTNWIGLVVATAGSPAAQTGATTAPSPPAKIV